MVKRNRDLPLKIRGEEVVLLRKEERRRGRRRRRRMLQFIERVSVKRTQRVKTEICWKDY